MKKIILIIVASVMVLAISGGLIWYFKFRGAGSKSGIDGEQAIEKVRAGYSETTAMNCQSFWSDEKIEGGWRVICNRKDYNVGSTRYEFNYTYYLVDNAGKVVKVGNYVKETDAAGKEQMLGEKRWGIPNK